MDLNLIKNNIKKNFNVDYNNTNVGLGISCQPNDSFIWRCAEEIYVLWVIVGSLYNRKF